MALADLQRALATLYTDESARERLRSDPTAFAESFRLGPVEFEQVRGIADVRLHAYVDSLDRKRASEAARLLPLSACALGPSFRKLFRRYARAKPLPAGDARHREDTVAFARSLQTLPVDRQPAPAAVELLDYEARSLAAAGGSWSVQLRAYRYPIEQIARAVGEGRSIDDIKPRHCIVAWMGRRVRMLCLPAGL